MRRWNLLLKKLLPLIILWRWGWNDDGRLGVPGSRRHRFWRLVYWRWFIIHRLSAKTWWRGIHCMRKGWRLSWNSWWVRIWARMKGSCKWSWFWVFSGSFCLVCIAAKVVNHAGAGVDWLTWCWWRGKKWVYPPWLCLVIGWFPILCMSISWRPEIMVQLIRKRNRRGGCGEERNFFPMVAVE